MALANRKVVDRYLKLVQQFPLKTIRNDKALGKAETRLHELLDSGDLNKDEREYLEVLGKLIKEYEEEHHPIEDVSDADMLAHLIESKEVTQRAVAEATGIPESTISDLLAGRREFNRGHIEKLASYFRISPAAFFKAKQAVPASPA